MSFPYHLIAYLDLPYIAIFQNSESDVDKYGNYEWLIGLADENATTFTTWEELEKSDSSWKMGVLPYELKNQFEPSVKSPKEAEIAFPEVVFFVPQLIIKQKRNTEDIEYEGNKNLLVRTRVSSRVSNLLKGLKPLEKPQFVANFTQKEYLSTIEKLRNHIKEGDFYEINLTQRFLASIKIENPFLLYQKLVEISPVPFATYLRFQDKYLLCASPERFLRLQDKELISQPIKGTIKRGKTAEEDKELAQILRNSPKEQAENVMIVDLTRNDLYRSAEINSVNVPHLFEVQTFPQVHQLVSTVSAIKKANISPYQAIKNAFPPGSMTGAPKVKVMQIIDKYESVARGIYAGSAGFFTPKDDFDFNVIIRSLIYDDTQELLSYHVGGAITYDSIAEEEYQESLLKAMAIRKVFEMQQNKYM